MSMMIAKIGVQVTTAKNIPRKLWTVRSHAANATVKIRWLTVNTTHTDVMALNGLRNGQRRTVPVPQTTLPAEPSDCANWDDDYCQTVSSFISQKTCNSNKYYQKYCKKTCGKCEGPCEDRILLEKCLYLKNVGECVDDNWYTKKNCIRTCGFECTETTTSTTTTTTTTTTTMTTTTNTTTTTTTTTSKFAKYLSVHTERNWGLTGNRAKIPHYSHIWPLQHGTAMRNEILCWERAP